MDDLLPKPSFRGVSHQYAFWLALAGGVTLVALAARPLPVAVYAVSLCLMLGTSALYHRRAWTAAAAARMRRLDHSMIFVFVAGSYTPMMLVVAGGTLGTVLAVVAWLGAAGGVALSLGWIDAPRWVTAGAYVLLGWAGMAAAPAIVRHAGAGCLALVIAGGLLYTAGAVVYARKRPDPWPAVFGFHEVFHAFVLAAAAAHFAAVALYALG